MATINGVKGKQFPKGANQYDTYRYQYALSSYKTDNRIAPALVINPVDKDDIASTIKYANSQKIAVAIKTGGHQYSGASSTVAPNIQLNLKETFRADDDRRIFQSNGETFVRTSVSWNLGEFNKWLGQNKLFIPHGQCENVHIGGHVQTGGYGQLGRSFGLFGDHVVSLEIVDHEGKFKEVTKSSDKELFHAILGGSPGNLGVITHFTIKVYRDEDYTGSRGLKSIYWYSPETLKRLLDILVEMADDEDFDRNYDYCVSCLSETNKLTDFMPEIDNQMRFLHPDIYGDDDLPFWPKIIIVYAQWVPFSKTDVPDMTWFDRIREGSILDLPVLERSMSDLTREWIFFNSREFDHPYTKSTYSTTSKTLKADGWSSWMAGRVDAIVKSEENKCYLSSQFQNFGGKNSKFFTNKDNGTAYSFRDSTIFVTLDCFYETDHKQTADDWHTINGQEGIGPNGKFSKQDRRVLWGSFGSYDLDANWQLYYDDRESYDRLVRARSVADPNGVFTPNTFSVAREIRPTFLERIEGLRPGDSE